MSSATATSSSPEGDHDAFRHRFTSTVRFGDLDAMGHLNNLSLLRLLETGRVDYMVDLELAAHNELTFVLASLTVDFRAQAFYGDELVCGSRMSRVGRTSMTFAQRIWLHANGVTVADAESVMVSLGEDATTPVEVPAGWRAAIGAFEPQPVPGSPAAGE